MKDRIAGRRLPDKGIESLVQRACQVNPNLDPDVLRGMDAKGIMLFLPNCEKPEDVLTGSDLTYNPSRVRTSV